MMVWKFFSLIGLSAFWLSISVLDTPTATATPLSIAQAQQSPSPVNDTTLAQQGQRLLERAQQLLAQNTGAARQEAIPLLQEALEIWKTLEYPGLQATTLLSLGTLYYQQSDHQTALQYFNEGLTVSRLAHDALSEVYLLSSIANAYLGLDQAQQALDTYDQALAIVANLNQPIIEANILFSVGNAYNNLGQSQAAIDAYQQSLANFTAAGAMDGQTLLLGALGLIYLNNGQSQLALDQFNQALALHEQAGNLAGIIDSLTYLGLAQLSLGNNQQALQMYQEALSILETLEDSGLNGSDLMQSVFLYSVTAAAYANVGQIDTAIATYNRALDMARATQNPEVVADIANDLALFYQQWGEPQRALSMLQDNLQTYQRLAQPVDAASTLRRIADVYLSLGENQQALDAYHQALQLLRQTQSRNDEANTLGELAATYATLGNLTLAITTQEQALQIFQETGNEAGVAKAYESLGGLYRRQGDQQMALRQYETALELHRTQQNRQQEVATLFSLVRTYENLEDYDRGLTLAQAALDIAKAQEQSFLVASAWAFIGRIHLAMAAHSDALAAFSRAQAGFQAVDNPLAEAGVLSNIGKTYRQQQRYPEAIAAHTAERNLYAAIANRSGEAEALFHLANVESDRDNLKEAQAYIEEAIALVEDLRTNIASQDLRTSFFETVQSYYELYIDLLMRQHSQNPNADYAAQALHISERGRARSLLELLTEANADIRQGIDPTLLNEEQQLQVRLQAIEEQLVAVKATAAQPDQYAPLEAEQQRLLAQYQQLQSRIRATSPKYAALNYPEPLTLDQIQSQVLDSETVLLQYALGDERSYLWVVTDTELYSYVLPGQQQLEAIARPFRDAILRRRPVESSARQLADVILQPAAAQLQGTRLVVVGDGILQYIPFQALPYPGEQAFTPLISRYEMVNLPSSSTLATLRQNQTESHSTSEPTLTILADPVFDITDPRVTVASPPASQRPPEQDWAIAQDSLDQATREFNRAGWSRLPGTQEEAEAIAQLVPEAQRSLLSGFAATRSAVLENPDLARSQIIHLATHGLLNSETPELSGLVLSLVDATGQPQNGYVRLHDIFNLELQSQLVVLSACQTGLGQVVRGEGIIGLTRGFMYAGTPRVIVSLWNVDDTATAELMTRFYHNLLQQQLSPAAALRQAQLELQQQTEWTEPFYWAGFTLQGEWQYSGVPFD